MAFENKEIYDLLEEIITANYPTATFINGNKVEIQELLHQVESTAYPVFIYYAKHTIDCSQKQNQNLIEKTSFIFEVLSLQDHDFTVAEKDTAYETNKEKGQIVLNSLSIKPNIMFAEGEEMSYRVSRIEEAEAALLVGAGFDVSAIPVQKVVNYCVT